MILGVSFIISVCVDLAVLNTRKLIQLYRINPSQQKVSVVCGALVVSGELLLLSLFPPAISH